METFISIGLAFDSWLATEESRACRQLPSRHVERQWSAPIYGGSSQRRCEAIKDRLPGREETVGVTARDNRLFVEAVLYRYRAGIAWRDLPERFGDWKN